MVVKLDMFHLGNTATPTVQQTSALSAVTGVYVCVCGGAPLVNSHGTEQCVVKMGLVRTQRFVSNQKGFNYTL